jgi:hypothetical protein
LALAFFIGAFFAEAAAFFIRFFMDFLAAGFFADALADGRFLAFFAAGFFGADFFATAFFGAGSRITGAGAMIIGLVSIGAIAAGVMAGISGSGIFMFAARILNS